MLKAQDIERLKSRIILYREINSNKNLIKKIIEKDLQKLIDTILVIETAIKVSNIKYLVIEFSCVVKA